MSSVFFSTICYKWCSMKIELNKSIKERTFHAVLFEILANVIIAFSVAYFLRVTIIQSASLSIISALIATVWNYLFNYIFDYYQKIYKFQRNWWVRVLHAFIFETGLIIVLTPACMFFLNIPFLSAVYVEIGLVLFFLPYTFLFNLIYDHLRWHIIGKRRKAMVN